MAIDYSSMVKETLLTTVSENIWRVILSTEKTINSCLGLKLLFIFKVKLSNVHFNQV